VTVHTFEPGQAAALREIWEGRIWSARAVTVVEDAEDQITLFIPAGAHWMAPFRDGRRLKLQEPGYELVEQPYKAHVLSFAWPGSSAAVLLFYESDWSPSHWYVNLEDPLRRSPVGFDTLDHKLDAIVQLDGSWSWKDEDELAEIIERGLLDPGDERRLRAEAEDAIGLIVGRAPPFDRDWFGWRPDPSWSEPALPEGWDRV
jgi:predicted RNA-binding protein associated with RNAse of E/G family